MWNLRSCTWNLGRDNLKTRIVNPTPPQASPFSHTSLKHNRLRVIGLVTCQGSKCIWFNEQDSGSLVAYKFLVKQTQTSPDLRRCDIRSCLVMEGVFQNFYLRFEIAIRSKKEKSRIAMWERWGLFSCRFFFPGPCMDAFWYLGKSGYPPFH